MLGLTLACHIFVPEMMHSRTSILMKAPQNLSSFKQVLEVLGERGQKLGKNEANRHNRRNQVGIMAQRRTAPDQVERNGAVVSQLTSSLARAFLVAVLVMIPSLLLSSTGSDTEQFVIILALIAASMTFIEYYGRSPSIVEFRFAPPYNRLKFFGLFASVTLLSFICIGHANPSDWTHMLTYLGTGLGHAIDFPYSPVRLMVLMLPTDASPELVDLVRTTSGIAYTISILMLFVFVTFVRLLGWPTRSGAFNVWMNLPLFDPTGGGDVLARLKRDAGLNIVLGALLPFIIPAAVKAASALIDPVSIQDPQTLIWTVTAWAFLPASMLMRGIAMSRIADMIEEKRRRAYAEAKAQAGRLQRA